MKIRDKLTISFSVISTLIFLLFGLLLYFFSAQYRKNEFYNRLKDRVSITEKMFLERSSFSDDAYEKIREEFLQTLPEETEDVVKLEPGFESAFHQAYPEGFLDDLIANEEAYFIDSNRQGAAKVFHLQDGDYMVIITAVDHIGLRKLTYMMTLIVLGIAACIIIIILVSYLLSAWILTPISAKIQKANTISVKNLHERLKVYNVDDEMGELAIAFNNLLDRLNTAFDAQKSFIANASHEMRNPLTAILGETELSLDHARTPKEYVESLRAIAQEADRLNLLVNNLLQVSTISADGKIIKSEVADILHLLEEARRQFDFINPDNRIMLRFNNDNGRHGPFVKCNKSLLHTAFINIFDNACKFSSNDEVDVILLSADQDKVQVSVRDKGVGIPAIDIPKIREPFHRASNVRHIKGSGIGIPLTLRIIELHNGSLEVQSELGKGTNVTIILPVATQ